MPQLKKLLAWNNQLSGPIPATFGEAPVLRSIELAFNQLEGNIPPELGNTPNLEGIFISHNRLTGSLPPELGQLTKLTSLTIGDNDLSGPLPTSLVNLENLTGFHFNNTGMCVPDNETFLEWLSGIQSVQGTDSTCAVTSVVEEQLIEQVRWSSVFPNPVRHVGYLRIENGHNAAVEMELYDTLGRRVRTVFNGRIQGTKTIELDATGLSSGVYMLRIIIEDRHESILVVVQQ